MTLEAIKEKRRKQSESMKGKNNWIKGKKHIHKGEIHIMVYPEQLENYLNNGYELGLPKSLTNTYKGRKLSEEYKKSLKGKNTWIK